LQIIFRGRLREVQIEVEQICKTNYSRHFIYVLNLRKICNVSELTI